MREIVNAWDACSSTLVTLPQYKHCTSNKYTLNTSHTNKTYHTYSYKKSCSDDAYGQFCPEASGFEVGECLKKQADLPEACTKYITINDVCKADIEAHCTGKEYTGDLIVCLSEWTKPDLISDACKEVLPKKEESKKKELSAEEKKKAEKRRKIRRQATKMAQEAEKKKKKDTKGKDKEKKKEL